MKPYIVIGIFITRYGLIKNAVNELIQSIHRSFNNKKKNHLRGIDASLLKFAVYLFAIQTSDVLKTHLIVTFCKHIIDSK